MDTLASRAVALAEADRLAEVAGRLDPETPVPTCPGWTVTKLVRHSGSVQRWAAAIVGARATEPVDPHSIDLGLPAGPDGYPDWLREGASKLDEALAGAEPDEPVWTWGADQHVRFWARRVADELAVHRCDAELAAEIAPVIDAGLAVDVVEELLENLPSIAAWNPAVGSLRGSGESIHLHATDSVGASAGAGEWTIRLAPGGFTWERGHAKGDVAVRATASDLALLLYRRVSATDRRYERFGDAGLLDRWLDATAL